MGSLSTVRTRRLLPLLALSAAVTGAIATMAVGAGPGGWDHLGDRGTPGTDSLDLVASALAVTPGALYVGGEFTDAGGIPNADRIATWNGSNWGAVSSSTSQISNGRVSDIAVSAGKVYAGGTFQNAGGDANADFLAVWDGTSWEPFCDSTVSGPAFGGNVNSLEIIGQTLYVGGAFQNGAGIASADYLLACDLATGASTTTVVDPAHPFAGGIVYALAADSDGTLYAGGGFSNLENIAAADNVAFRPAGGTWQPMGAGGGSCECAVTTFVRGLTAVGTDVYVGTDATDIAGIPQADHVARWNGSAWSALGAGSGGQNGWFPAGTSINALAGEGSNLFVTGTFLNANGNARADNVAFFNGTDWHPVGSDATGNNGPWDGNGLALAIVDRQLYATGSFAHGDPRPERTAHAHGDPRPDDCRRGGRHGANDLAPQGADQPCEPQGDLQVRLRRARLHVPLQARRQEGQALHVADDLQEAQTRQARLPCQGARPGRQPRCDPDGKAVQGQEALGPVEATRLKPAVAGTSARPRSTSSSPRRAPPSG
jgi:hypothetical protein